MIHSRCEHSETSACCSQVLRRLVRSELPSTTQAFNKGRDAEAPARPQVERTVSPTTTVLKPAIAAAPPQTVTLLYGQAVANGGQLTFETSISPRSPFSSPPATSAVPDTPSIPPQAETLSQVTPPAMPPVDPPRSAAPGAAPSLQAPVQAEQLPPNLEQPDTPLHDPTITPPSPPSNSKPQAAAVDEAAPTDSTADAAPPISVPKRKFREREVPSSRLGRAVGFAGLGAGLVWGAATDAVSRALGPASTHDGSGMLSEANAQRLANALCRMRGAALKIGQMMSIQDDDVLPPAVAAALEKVRLALPVRRPKRATHAPASPEHRSRHCQACVPPGV